MVRRADQPGEGRLATARRSPQDERGRPALAGAELIQQRGVERGVGLEVVPGVGAQLLGQRGGLAGGGGRGGVVDVKKVWHGAIVPLADYFLSAVFRVNLYRG